MQDVPNAVRTACAGLYDNADSFYSILPSDEDPDAECCASCEKLMAKAQAKSQRSESNLPPSSAKIRMILRLLQQIEDRGEGEKTIIFSQFTSMLDLIEPFLKANGIRHVRCKHSFVNLCSASGTERIPQMTVP